MRLKNSVYNISSNFLIFIIKTILVFVVRNILIQQISQTYIGLNGLFTNILSVLSLAELGIGSAIGFSLYKPLNDRDNEKISILMSFYKKAYSIIGLIILGVGVVIIPFLPFVVGEHVDNMIVIYLMFLLNTCIQYFISYKEVLIISDQKNYKLTKINLLFTVLINVFEAAVLLLTSKFILYLSVQFVLTIVQKAIVNMYISKEYKEIDFNSKDKMDVKTKKDIFKNIKAMVYHKIGDCMINSTDNIIISAFIGVNTVGVYSNYLLIISYLTSFASMIYNGLLSSLGNFIVTESSERKHEMFRKTNFLGMTIFSYFSVLLINIFNVAIGILANDTYILGFETVLLIVLNFYMTGIRVPASNMKIAAGMFDIDKYTPIIQSLINIIISIILANLIGLNGVLIGTFLSSLLPTIQRPYIVYKHILNKSIKKYVLECAKNILITVLVALITVLINRTIIIESDWILLIQRGITTTIIFVVFYVLAFKNNVEFNYYKGLIKKMLRRSRSEG